MSDELREMWVSPEVLQWHLDHITLMRQQRTTVQRAYDIWTHAERTLSQATDEFSRADAITTLKRAVNHRLKSLNKLYKFEGIPVGHKPKGLLQLLHHFNIIRPLMLSSLIEVRNLIEHEDIPPPDQVRCEQFLDFAWYFLRSTDRLVENVAVHCALEPGDGGVDFPLIEMKFGLDTWIPQVTCGLLPHQLLSDLPVNGWMHLSADCVNVETLEEFLSRRPDSVIGDSLIMGESEDVVRFKGKLRGPEEHLLTLVRRYFSAYS